MPPPSTFSFSLSFSLFPPSSFVSINFYFYSFIILHLDCLESDFLLFSQHKPLSHSLVSAFKLSVRLYLPPRPTARHSLSRHYFYSFPFSGHYPSLVHLHQLFPLPFSSILSLPIPLDTHIHFSLLLLHSPSILAVYPAAIRVPCCRSPAMAATSAAVMFPVAVLVMVVVVMMSAHGASV